MKCNEACRQGQCERGLANVRPVLGQGGFSGSLLQWLGGCAVALLACACAQDSVSGPGVPPPIAGALAVARTTAGAGPALQTPSGAGLAGGSAFAGNGSIRIGSSAGTGAAGLDASVPDLDDSGPVRGARLAADGGASTSLPRDMQPIAAPVADACITDVSAGDHTYSCDGLTYLTLIDPMCTQYACGLIFDIHGEDMSGLQMRDSTQLYSLAPKRGYIVVNPSATTAYTGGSWDLTNDPAKVASFMDRLISAFHVDPTRVHMGGFSQGAVMTGWFLCNHRELLASAAPLSGVWDVSCLDDTWVPRVPIFYTHGTTDQSVLIETARRMINSIVAQLHLSNGMQIAGDTAYTRRHWDGSGGMALDYLEHDYGGQIVLDGHCVPGGLDTPTFGANNFGLNATTCVSGDIRVDWGSLALQWYEDHPRQP